MKKILIALCGKAPQVITETLYALYIKNSFPDRLVILTTEIGRTLCRAALLHPKNGKISSLMKHLHINLPLILRDEDILTPISSKHCQINDIYTEDDSRCFLNLCLQIVFTLSQDADSELIFSIAGGRKTMSAALVLAAQCYARPQDSMFHALVPQELETDRSFFYPIGQEKNANITLTPIPFFRMREHLPSNFFLSPATMETLSYVCMPQKPLHLLLQLVDCSLTCEKKTLHLPPALFAIYVFFAIQSTSCPPDTTVCTSQCHSCAISWSYIASKRNEILHIYEQIEGKRLARGNKGILNLSAANFRSSVSKLKKLFLQTFGPTTGARLCIASIKEKNSVAYCLRIPKTQVSIVSQRCDH